MQALRDEDVRDITRESSRSVDEAARILRLTPGRIRQMLRAGELETIPPQEGGGRGPGRGWKIPMHAVHDRDRPESDA